jgi:hypothetical protein
MKIDQKWLERVIKDIESDHGKAAYTEETLAEKCELTESKLRKDRQFGRGFPYVTLGRRSVRYLRQDVLRHLLERRTQTTD